VSYQVNWEILALDQAAGFLRDDPAGVAALWESISRLARPAAPAGIVCLRVARSTTSEGRPVPRLYAIDEERRVIQIDHVARLP
jgi:mRNA interferase RelE/StbE